MVIPYKKALRCDRKKENGFVQNKPIKIQTFWALTKFQFSFSFNYYFALSLQFLCSAGHRGRNTEIPSLTFWEFCSQCQSLNKVKFLLLNKGHACYNPKLAYINENRKLRQLRAKGEDGGYVNNPKQIYAYIPFFGEGSGPGVIVWERGKIPSGGKLRSGYSRFSPSVTHPLQLEKCWAWGKKKKKRQKIQFWEGVRYRSSGWGILEL